VMSIVEKVKDLVAPLVEQKAKNNSPKEALLHKRQKELLSHCDHTNGYHLVLSGGGLR